MISHDCATALVPEQNRVRPYLEKKKKKKAFLQGNANLPKIKHKFKRVRRNFKKILKLLDWIKVSPGKWH